MPRDPQAELEALKLHVATDPRIQAIKGFVEQAFDGPQHLPNMPNVIGPAWEAWKNSGPWSNNIEDRRGDPDNPVLEANALMGIRK